MFDGLYELISKDDDEAIIRLSNKKHPIFKAHFPQRPILPGFVHFEIIAEVFDLEIRSIKKAKFTDLVLPEQTLRYERKANKFRVFRKDKEVATLSL